MECLENYPKIRSNIYEACPLCKPYPGMTVAEAQVSHVLHEDYFYHFYCGECPFTFIIRSLKVRCRASTFISYYLPVV